MSQLKNWYSSGETKEVFNVDYFYVQIHCSGLSLVAIFESIVMKI